MIVRGYARKACLWQLMEHGQLNCMQLAAYIGSDTNTMFGVVNYLKGTGLVLADPVKVRVDGARSTVMYGLSRAGIAHAMTLDRSDATLDGAVLLPT